MTGRRRAVICRVLGIGRATSYRKERPRGRRYARADDRVVTAQIREIIRTRATYGARRVHALVNRTFDTAYNRKRIRRVMELAGWTLPKNARRRTGRRTGDKSSGPFRTNGGAAMASRSPAGTANTSSSRLSSIAMIANAWPGSPFLVI